MKILNSTFDFELPTKLACPEPTERRGIPRDAVRLLVSRENGSIEHATFDQLDHFLQKGDVLVVNTSATRPAAIPVDLPEQRKGRVHFSTRIGHSDWLVEIREVRQNKTRRWSEGTKNMEFSLPNGGQLKLVKPYYQNRKLLHLWHAELSINQNTNLYFAEHARPIQYENLEREYPLHFYQTLFSFHPGSAEMPSAGRGFTSSLIERLQEKGVVFAPILLHTGVSSLEENEKPYPEYIEVNPLSASVINHAKNHGKRIVAVGTTAVRAIESAVNEKGEVRTFKGHTSLYIDKGDEMKVVDALITGFHEPKASHLHMLQALAGPEHLEKSYSAALKNHYYWHQFGDLHLILP